jgi:hypothetical protein
MIYQNLYLIGIYTGRSAVLLNAVECEPNLQVPYLDHKHNEIEMALWLVYFFISMMIRCILLPTNASYINKRFWPSHIQSVHKFRIKSLTFKSKLWIHDRWKFVLHLQLHLMTDVVHTSSRRDSDRKRSWADCKEDAPRSWNPCLTACIV